VLLKILLGTVEVFCLIAAKILAVFVRAAVLGLLTYIQAPINIKIWSKWNAPIGTTWHYPRGKKPKPTGEKNNTGSLPYSHSCHSYKL